MELTISHLSSIMSMFEVFFGTQSCKLEPILDRSDSHSMRFTDSLLRAYLRLNRMGPFCSIWYSYICAQDTHVWSRANRRTGLPTGEYSLKPCQPANRLANRRMERWTFILARDSAVISNASKNIYRGSQIASGFVRLPQPDGKEGRYGS